MAGRDLPQLGINHIDTRVFDYQNPGKHLTFHWFKHTIMCRDNAWICEDPGKLNESRDGGEGGSRNSGGEGDGSGAIEGKKKYKGGKKSQRKKSAKHKQQSL